MDICVELDLSKLLEPSIVGKYGYLIEYGHIKVLNNGFATHSNNG